MTTNVPPDQIRVTIELGDDVQPSARLVAAIDELTAALREEPVAEVAGFMPLATPILDDRCIRIVRDPLELRVASRPATQSYVEFDGISEKGYD